MTGGPLSLTTTVSSSDVIELAVVWRDSVEIRRELYQDPIYLFGPGSMGLLEPWPLDILAALHPGAVRTLADPAIRHARKVKKRRNQEQQRREQQKRYGGHSSTFSSVYFSVTLSMVVACPVKPHPPVLENTDIFIAFQIALSHCNASP